MFSMMKEKVEYKGVEGRDVTIVTVVIIGA